MTPIQEEALAAQVEKFFGALSRPSFSYTDIIGESLASSWTPTLTFATPGNLSVSYTTRLGQVLKVGPIVFGFFNVLTSGFTHTTASGALQITGFPYTCLTGFFGVGPVIWAGITKTNYTYVASRMVSASATIDFLASGSGQASSGVAAADMPSGGTVLLAGMVFSLVKEN